MSIGSRDVVGFLDSDLKYDDDYEMPDAIVELD